MEHSLFRPLHSLQAHPMEKCQLPLAAGPSLFTISPLSPPPNDLHSSFTCFDADIITLSSYRKAKSEQDLTLAFTHVLTQLPLPHSALATTSPCTINGNLSSSDQHPLSHSSTTASPRTACLSRCDAGDDDGSVASTLLSITKSISSPLLHLASSKESARETPYQKALKLKQMKLQHCAEELGTESSDVSSLSCHSERVYEEKIDMEGNAYGSPPSFISPYSHQESSLKSVRSLPNMSNALPVMTNQPRFTRTASFPPPLSHTLPISSSSSDSQSLSLRAYREDGRFILKETMVPSKNYFHTSRRNGRLTLHVVTRDQEVGDNNGFSGQDDHNESSHRETEEQDLVEVFVDEVCGKKDISMHTVKDTNVPGTHLDVALQKSNCMAHHHSHNSIEDGEEDDKSNVISNVFTVSLQASSNSKATLHQAQLTSHPEKSTGGFLSSNHDISAFTQSKQNYIWESNFMPCAVASSRNQCAIQRNGNRRGRGGALGGRGATVPAFVMKQNMTAESLMKAVPGLATSLMLEANYGKGDWCIAGEKNSLISTAGNGGYDTIVRGGYASNNIDNAIISGKFMGKHGHLSHGATLSYNSSYFKEEEKTSDGGKGLHMTTPSLNLDLQFSSSASWEEWLQTLHCKELFDRHHLGHGFTKLPCIPTRS